MIRSCNNLRVPDEDPAPFIQTILALEDGDKPAISRSYQTAVAKMAHETLWRRHSYSRKDRSAWRAELERLGLL